MREGDGSGAARGRPLRELAAAVSGELLGDGDLTITGCNGLEDARPGELSFYGSSRYRDQLLSTRASAVLVSEGAPPRDGVTYVRVKNPHLAYAKVLALFHPQRRPEPGVRPGAFVSPSARVHPTATVMAGATVEAGAEVGARTVISAGAFVGEGARIGEDCLLHPNATVRERCVLGNRVVLHSGSVVGADGFGFAFDPEGPAHVKVPQVGIVRIEDDVEVGACTCIDRATVGETVIGRGSKLDNLVQIAHNVKVGPMSLICAQAGVSGSAELGTGVVLAGQVGVVGHIRVGDLVKVGAQSGVAQSVPDGEVVSGSPAIPHRQWLRTVLAYAKLPELLREVARLTKRVEALEKEKRG